MTRRLLLLLAIAGLSVGAGAQIISHTAYNIRSGSSLPATCNPGPSVTDVFIETSAGGSPGPYYCSATNTWTAMGGGGGSGTVTTFSAGNLSPLFISSVANPTTTPALTFSLSTQTANTIFAGPTTGSAATPTFRSLVSADIPNNAANTTGNAATATALSTSGSTNQFWYENNTWAQPSLDQINPPAAVDSKTFTLGNVETWTGATPSSVGSGTGTNADADVFSCIGGTGGATTGTNQVGGVGGGCLLEGGPGGTSNGTGAPANGGDIILQPGAIGNGTVTTSPYGRTGQVQMKFAAPFGDSNCGTTNLGTFGQCHGGLAYSPSVVLWNTNTSTSTAPQQTPWLIFRSNNDVTAGASTQIDWQMMAQPCTIAANSVAIAAGPNQVQCFNLTNQTANITGIPEWAFVFGATGGALQWNVNGSFFIDGIAAGMNLVANGTINLQGDGTGATGANDVQISQRGFQTPTGTAATIIGGWNTTSATELDQYLGVDTSGGNNTSGGVGKIAPGRGAGTGAVPRLELDAVNLQASGSNPQTYGEALATIVPSIGLTNQSSAITTTTLYTTAAISTYLISATAPCHTQVATATVIITLKYTDPSSTSETLTSSTATCTTLGTNSVANVAPTVIRAASGTVISYAVAITNSAVFDLGVSLLQLTNN